MDYRQLEQVPNGQGRMEMKRQLTLPEYRNIDLALFGVILAVFEFIIVRVSNMGAFWDQPYTVSLAAAITSIIYMRWGYWGALHAALSGFLFCLFSGGTVNQYMIYTLGNLLSLAAVPVLKKLGHEKVRERSGWSLLFALAVIVLMWSGRALTALLLGAPAAGVVGFFTTDSLSALFTLVIIWIARRLDGVFEEQKHYLLRIQQEKER